MEPEPAPLFYKLLFSNMLKEPLIFQRPMRVGNIRKNNTNNS